MGVRERFEQSGQKIIDAYSTLQEQIFEVIINTLKESDYKHVDKEDVVLWQAEQLQKLGRLNLQAIKLMAETDGLSQTAIEDLIKFHGLQIKQEIDSKLQHVTGSPIPSSEETELLIKGIVDQTWNDLQNNVNETLITRNYGNSAITQTYRRILTESTAATVSGLMTHEDAVNLAIQRAVDRGLPTKLIDKAGHN